MAVIVTLLETRGAVSNNIHTHLKMRLQELLNILKLELERVQNELYQDVENTADMYLHKIAEISKLLKEVSTVTLEKTDLKLVHQVASDLPTKGLEALIEDEAQKTTNIQSTFKPLQEQVTALINRSKAL